MAILICSTGVVAASFAGVATATDFVADRLLLTDTSGAHSIALVAPISIPLSWIDPAMQRLLAPATLGDRVQSLLASLQSVELQAGAGFVGLQRFQGLSVAASGQVRCRVQVDAQGYALSLELKIAAGALTHGGAQVAVSAMLSLRVSGTGVLSQLALPELGWRWPEVALPSLDWSALQLPAVPDFAMPFELPSTLFGHPLALRVAPDLVLNVVYDPASQALACTSNQVTVQLLLDGAELATVDQAELALDAATSEVRVSGTLIIGASLPLPDGQLRLGVCTLAWEGMHLKAAVTGPVGGPFALVVDQDVGRLTLAAVADPSARVAVSGGLRWRDGRIEVRRLALLEPTAIELLASVTELLTPIGATVRQIAVTITQASAAAIKAVADVLVRIARAVADSTLAVGQVVATALQGLARAVGDLLARWSAPSMGGPPTGLSVELRFSGGWRLQQLLVWRVAATAPIRLDSSVLGLELAAGWHPGVLVDLQARRVGLLASRALTTGTVIGSIETDLWLDNGQGVEHEATRDRANGQTPAQPLVRLDLSWKGPDTTIVLMPLAIVDGKAEFLRIASATNAVSLPGGLPLSVGAAMQFGALTDAQLGVGGQIDDRILSWLTPQAANSGPSWMDALTQYVRVTHAAAPSFANGAIVLPLKLTVSALGLAAETKVDARLDIDTFHTRLGGAGRVRLKGAQTTRAALGFDWTLSPNANGELLDVLLDPRETRIGLAQGAKLSLLQQIGVPAAQQRGQKEIRKLRFDVNRLDVHRGGLDLDASVAQRPLILSGLDQPFQLTRGQLSLRSSRLSGGSVAGYGYLPPELIGEARVGVALVLGEEDGKIRILDAGADLDKSGDPIYCANTRFEFRLSAIGFKLLRVDSEDNFYFTITGSARFKPAAGEFADGLLQYLKDVELALEQVPVCSDARVIGRYLRLQVPIKPRRSFNCFNIFDFELRSIGFHPQNPAFGDAPSLRLSGQIKFTDIGDIAQPSIDFHGLEIAPPAAGGALPRVRCEGLTVDLSLSTQVRICGSVSVVDKVGTPSLVGSALPDEIVSAYDSRGFLGSGRLVIDGFVEISAAFGFMDVRDREGRWKKAFFLYLQRDRVSYKIPTPLGPIFLREAGFGFGYRYTLAGIRAIDEVSDIPTLIGRLDDLSKRQGELASYRSWAVDPDEPTRLTLALRGLISHTTASQEEKYNAQGERDLANTFLFDAVLALRSDFTLFMNLRAWLLTNYADYLANTDNLRDHPTMRGYLFLSAPRREFLARFVSDGERYIGKHPELPAPIVEAAKAVEWSSTLYIRPGLFHFEYGWPDQLRFALRRGPFELQCAGGLLLRVEDRSVLHALNLEARARLQVGGQVGSGSFGASATATIEARALARLFARIDAGSPRRSELYGLFEVEASVRFAVSAWLRFKVWRFTVSLSVSFSFSVFVSAAVEMLIGGNDIAARVDARVGISAFGRRLSVPVRLTLNEGGLAAARERVKHYLNLGLSPNAPRLTPAVARAAPSALDAPAIALAAVPAAAPMPDVPTGLRMLVLRLHRELRPAADVDTLVFLVPNTGFYLAPSFGIDLKPQHDGRHRLDIPADGPALWWPTGAGQWKRQAPGWTSASHGIDWARVLHKDQDEQGNPVDFTFAHALSSAFVPDPAGAYGDPDREEYTRRAPSGTEAENPADEMHQLAAAYLASTTTIADHDEARQARAVLLAQFVEQATRYAESKHWPAEPGAFSLGVCFALRAADLAALNALRVCYERDGVGPSYPVQRLLQRPFTADPANGAPRFEQPRGGLDRKGVRLDWQLTRDGADAEDCVRHYRIVRRVEGLETTPGTVLFKPADLVGRKSDVNVYQRPQWCYVDDLADLPADVRTALLPGTTLDGELAAANAWAQLYPGARSRQIHYDITPVDCEGNAGATLSVRVDVPRPQPVVRAAEGTIVLKLSLGEALQHDRLAVSVDINDPWWGEGSAGVQRTHRLLVRRTAALPVGEYGADGLTDDELSPALDIAADEALRATDRFFELTDLTRDAEKPARWYGVLAGAELARLTAWLRPNPHSNDAPNGHVCYLETAVEVAATGIRYHSRRVRMDLIVELLASAAPQMLRRLRPTHFEWPLRDPLQALESADLACRTGFLSQWAPAGAATLQALLDKTPGTLTRIRDPKRRTAAFVRFNRRSHTAADERQARGYSGYQLRELDLAELPPDAFDLKSAQTWKRARLAQSIQLLPRWMARQIPADPRDYHLWEANYPSDSARALRPPAAGAQPLQPALPGGDDALLEWPAPAPANAFFQRLRSTLEGPPDDAGRRRYRVLDYTPPPVPAGELAAWFSATGPALDPYGWALLTRLGLTLCFQLYDQAEAEYLSPEALLTKAQDALQQLLVEYATLKPHIQVEVMLQPAQQLTLEDFDGEDHAAVALELDDRGLGFVQVSLRPQPIPLTTRVRVRAADGTDAPTLLRIGASASMLVWAEGQAQAIDAHQDQLKLHAKGANGWTLYLRHPHLVQPDLSTLTLLATDVQNRPVALAPIVAETPDLDESAGRFALGRDGWQQALIHSPQRCAAWSGLNEWLPDALRLPGFDSEAAIRTSLQRLYDAGWESWSARFIRHHAGTPDAAAIPFALAAPVRQNPWRLAPDGEGTIEARLVFEHRYAESLAYAVQPQSRYAALLRAIGMEPAASPGAPGLCVAVIPRTERVEPPTLALPSAHLPAPPLESDPPPPRRPALHWDLLIARHPEQQLADANRELAARTGFEAIALSFAARLRYRDWVARFPPAPDPSPPALATQPAPELPEPWSDQDYSALLSAEYWPLYQGADVYRYASFPHYYEVAALAYARAGIAVSPIVAQVQRDFHYTLAHASQTVMPRLVDSAAGLRLHLPLLSMSDVLDADVRARWVGAADSSADLPDPLVAYQLVAVSAAGVRNVLADVLAAPAGQHYAVYGRDPGWVEPMTPLDAEDAGAHAWRLSIPLADTGTHFVVDASESGRQAELDRALRTLALPAPMQRYRAYRVSIALPADAASFVAFQASLQTLIGMLATYPLALPDWLQTLSNVVDLQALADLHGVQPAQLAQLHGSFLCHADAGFAPPGFALSDTGATLLWLPRRALPATDVAALQQALEAVAASFGGDWRRAYRNALLRGAARLVLRVARGIAEPQEVDVDLNGVGV